MGFEFTLFKAYTGEFSIGFSLFEIDLYREDEMAYALLGFQWDKEDRFIGIDIFWEYFEIKLKTNNLNDK